MTTLSRVGVVPMTAAIRRFTLHFLEMCVAMCAGGVALNVLVFGAAGSLGHPDLVARQPELAILIVALDLATAMALYMAVRGHSIRHNIEMSLSTFVGAIPFVAALRLGALPSESLESWPRLFAFMCGPLCLLMLLVMLVRFDHYGGRIGVAATPGAVEATGEYVCPMHPEVRLAGPGRCPRCDMKLIRRTS